MSTLNGFGTLYFGWRHAADGTSTATKWFAVSWVPVVPLYRQRLRVLTNFSNPEPLKSELGGLVVSQQDRYEIVEPLPLSAKEVATTLAKTYLGLPAILFGPLVVAALLMKSIQALGYDATPGSTAFTVFIGLVFASIGNLLLQSVRAIRRARGWQPRV